MVVTRRYRDLGREIKAARLKSGMRQVDLAEQTGISPGYPPQIESGRVRPEPGVLNRIAGQLGVDYLTLAQKAGYVRLPRGKVAITIERTKEAPLRELGAFSPAVLRALVEATRIQLAEIAQPEGETAGEADVRLPKPLRGARSSRKRTHRHPAKTRAAAIPA